MKYTDELLNDLLNKKQALIDKEKHLLGVKKCKY